MVSDCCVCKVSQGVIDNVSFHSFPKNDERREQWLKSVNMTVSKKSCVCSQHFRETDFIYKVVGDSVRRFLKQTACPTLSLDNNSIRVADTGDICKSVSEDNQNKNSCEIMCNENVNSCISETESTSNEKINETTKRKNSEELNFDTKRVCNPRYMGDLRKEHFMSESVYFIVKKYYDETQKKLNTLHQKVNRLQKKFNTMEELTKHLKSIGLLSDETEEALQVGPEGHA
ncbi:hypothetical protein ALC57_01119 [Trachymyrmex cornetzi]|uniref:THAP-type domain-containing protein n=1 Tax=Trachymyrmex cornetzi TaxID=471704 RepID=A0A151JQI2_9HYME|nr:hypothetical protein ALC57_01119 [Trachymyrmex cornetzi]